MIKRSVYRNREWRELIAYRTGAGLSQAELGERVGANRADISRMERGLWLPTHDTQQLIAEALGVTYEALEQGAMRLRVRDTSEAA